MLFDPSCHPTKVFKGNFENGKPEISYKFWERLQTAEGRLVVTLVTVPDLCKTRVHNVDGWIDGLIDDGRTDG